MGVSRTKIDQAGAFLRAWWRVTPDSEEDASFSAEALNAAISIVQDYRAGFQHPLNKVTVGLRQFVDREADEIIVGQRLKRTPQILNKLDRFGSMRLTQMEDVAGCRAILPGGAAEVAGVLKRIRRNWDVVNLDDYVAEPKSTGYRAIHVVVKRDGHPVEIQLRTPAQQEWAEAVERLDATRPEFRLKDGVGPPELLTYFEFAAWGMAVNERGESVDPGFMRAFENLRGRVHSYLAVPR